MGIYSIFILFIYFFRVWLWGCKCLFFMYGCMNTFGFIFALFIIAGFCSLNCMMLTNCIQEQPIIILLPRSCFPPTPTHIHLEIHNTIHSTMPQPFANTSTIDSLQNTTLQDLKWTQDPQNTPKKLVHSQQQVTGCHVTLSSGI